MGGWLPNTDQQHAKERNLIFRSEEKVNVKKRRESESEEAGKAGKLIGGFPTQTST